MLSKLGTRDITSSHFKRNAHPHQLQLPRLRKARFLVVAVLHRRPTVCQSFPSVQRRHRRSHLHRLLIPVPL